MASITDPIPNNPFYSTPTNSLSSQQGELIVGSGLIVDPYGNILVSSGAGGTVTQVTAGLGLGAPVTGAIITATGIINLLPPSGGNIGGVKAGANVTIAADGTLSVAAPGTGTISAVTAGNGLQGGGVSGNVTLNLRPATAVTIGGVIVGTGLAIDGSANLSLGNASTGTIGGVRLATSTEVITGTDNSKAITPAGLTAKVASTSAAGIVSLSSSTTSTSQAQAATPLAVKTAYDLAAAASVLAADALPLTGGTMLGPVVFAAGQTFSGITFPIATTTSTGVVQVGAGLNVTAGGIISTIRNGTVTQVIAGTGLGAPSTGNAITASGTINLLPPSANGLIIGGVKKGDTIDIALDGTITTTGVLKTNNVAAYNSYIWPTTAPLGILPGTNGQVLTVLNNVTGTIGWANTGTLSNVVGGPGITASVGGSTATVSLANIPSVTAGDFGGTALIPTLSINQYGQITSVGEANPFVPFQIASESVPAVLIFDFVDNNTNWTWTLQANTTFPNPLNAESGQTGAIVITQNSSSAFTIVWGMAWKWPNGTPFTGNVNPGGVDMVEFTVLSPNYIIVTNVIENIG